MNDNKSFLGTEPIGKLLMKLALPTVAAQLINMLYNIVDRIYIGHIPGDGALALTGVGVCMPIIMIVSAFAALVGNGGAPRATIYMGKKDNDTAERILGNCFTAQIIISAVLTMVLLIWNRDLLLAFGASENTIDYAVAYMNIYAFGTVFVQITLGMNLFITAQGFAKTGMLSVLLGAVTNIILDPILIFGCFGFPALGIAGAAYATIAGQILTLILDAWFHYAWNHEINGSLRYLKPCAQTIINIYRVGAPAILMQVLMSVMSYGINIIFGFVCEAAVTAFGIYYKIQQFVFFAAFGMNNAVIPVVAFNYGKGDLKRITQGLKYGMTYTLILMFTGAVFLQLFAAPICSMFALSPEAMTLCIRAIHIVTLGYLFAGANIIFQGVFQALGCGIKSLILSLIRLIIVPLPLTWILTQLPQSQTFIWTAFPAAEAIGLVVAVIFIRNVFNHRLSGLKNHA